MSPPSLQSVFLNLTSDVMKEKQNYDMLFETSLHGHGVTDDTAKADVGGATNGIVNWTETLKLVAIQAVYFQIIWIVGERWG